jgi:PAS domain S-box-containing protein
MLAISRSPLLSYGLAVLVTVLALGLTLALQPLIAQSVFAFFLAGVLICAWWGGRGPGISATVLAFLALDYFLIPPLFALWPKNASALVRLGLFLWVAALIITATEALHAARRRAEESARALEENEARFRGVVDSNMLGVLFWNTQDQITDGNDAAVQLLGYSREEFRSRQLSWATLNPTFTRVRPEARERLRQRGPDAPFEREYVRKDGTRRPVLVGCAFLPGSADEGVAFLLDITERRRLEEQLRLQAEVSSVLTETLDLDLMLERLARLMVPSLADWCMIHLMEADGQLSRVAASHVDPAKEALVQQLRHPPDPNASSDVWQVLRTRQPLLVPDVGPTGMESYARDPEQREVIHTLGPRSSLLVPLVAHGRALGTLTMVAAESGRRYGKHDLARAEEIARRASLAIDSARLYQAVRQELAERQRLEQALQQRVAELAQADRQKDEFLAMLAHELRNPLAPIRNAVELFKQWGPSEPRMIRACEIIERQVRQQARLLDDLLDVSRISRGKITLRQDCLNLVSLVRDAAEDCRGLLDQAGVKLALELPEEPVWVLGDSTRLTQVVGNLLHNSAKFTERDGQVTVRLTPAPGGQATIAVRDTGIGIDPELLPHIFDTFTQADRSLERNRGGLGLGLALVKGLVEQHGGVVRAESGGIGRGTQFTVTLPTVTPPLSPSNLPTGIVRDGPLRLLIIEDSRDAADTLRDLLEGFGCTVEVAYSGPDGVDAARRFRPEVVLCDLGLPGMNGFEVAATLRRERETANARLIALSGYGQEEDQRRSREAGFDLHLVKPVDFYELQRLLEVSSRPPSPHGSTGSA